MPPSTSAAATLAGPRRWLAPMAILAATLIAGCSKPEPVAHEEKPRPVRSMVVKASDGSERWTLAGDIRPRIEVRYGFRVGGRLIERKVETGDQIKAGQVLARLDPTDLQPMLDAQRAQQEAARTELALARADLTRAERLRAGNFVSDANVDRSRAAVDAAKARLEAATAQVDQARNSLGFQVLRADTPGVVTAVDAEAGQVVAVGQSVVRIARAGEIEVAVAVPSGRSRCRACLDATGRPHCASCRRQRIQRPEPILHG